jgi:hypothetical protein
MAIREFQWISPIQNIPSVLLHGILSYESAAKLSHASVAMQEVQERRDKVQIPGGLRLHQYANLYFHARNPMLFKRKGEASTLCVIRVSTEARHIPGSVIADRNASSDYVRFLSVAQAGQLDLDAIYARDWTHPGDHIAYYRHKSQKCAEFLVPHRIPPEYIVGAYTVNEPAKEALQGIGFSLPIGIEPDLFFAQP